MNSNIIAFSNQKGGVGKTTCCINLAAAIKHLNQKVLLIDLDPQGNATMGSGHNKTTATYTSGDVLQEKITLSTAIVPTPYFDLLPSNMDVTEAEVNLLTQPNKQFKLAAALASFVGYYDWIFIDCPPSLNILTLNALMAADAVIIPMQCEYYALEGLSALIGTIEDLNYKFRVQPLLVNGIIRTMYDARNKLCKDVSEQLIQHFGYLVYQTIIPRNVRIAEAPSHGVPIFTYDQTSSGAKAYLKLAKELLQQYQTNQLSSQSTKLKTCSGRQQQTQQQPGNKKKSHKTTETA